MPKMNFGDVASQPPEKTIEVPAPEFGENMTVLVRPPTTADRVLIAKIINTDRVKIGDTWHHKYPPPVVVAALCAVDEHGDLVFGLTPMGAVNACLSMDGRYSPLFSRIALAVATAVLKNNQETPDNDHN